MLPPGDKRQKVTQLRSVRGQVTMVSKTRFQTSSEPSFATYLMAAESRRLNKTAYVCDKMVGFCNRWYTITSHFRNRL